MKFRTLLPSAAAVTGSAAFGYEPGVPGYGALLAGRKLLGHSTLEYIGLPGELKSDVSRNAHDGAFAITGVKETSLVENAASADFG